MRPWSEFRWSLPSFIATALVVTTCVTLSDARAAEVTDVADAADVIFIGDTERDDPFDLYVGADFDFRWANGKITGEPVDPHSSDDRCQAGEPRECIPVDEARFLRQTQVMNVHGQIGLFHDLALTLALPIYFGDTLKFRYAKGVGPGNSRIDGQTGNPDDTLFALRSDINSSDTTASKRAGLGNLELGLRFAPLNDERDDSKPNWVIFAKWGMPYTADTHDPSNTSKRATVKKPGPMGDGVHQLTFGTALSKRVAQFGLIGIDPNSTRRGYADPYMEFSYTLPIPQRGKAPRTLLNTDSNPFGHSPGHIARIKAGLEVVPFEDLVHDRKVAIDIGFRGRFCTEGRSYGDPDDCPNELADALGEIPYSEQNLSMMGMLGLTIQAAQYVRFNLGFGIGYITEHYLTSENVGEDTTGPNGTPDGQVLASDGDALNPDFCGNDPTDICSVKGIDSYDQVGFRFKAEEYTFINFFAGLMITF